MSSEEQVRQAFAEVRLFESYVEELRARIQVVLTTANELQTTKTALEELSKTAEGTPILVNLGAGVYGRAALADSKKALVDVGTGVVVEKTVPEALGLIDARISDMEKARATLEEQLSNFLGRLDRSRARLSELTSSLKEPRR